MTGSRWVAVAAFVFAFFVYWLTLCPTVYVEGSGELIGAAYYLGTPHPTGYPLFSLCARIVAVLLPWGSPAYKINFASALFAALASGAMAWLLYRRGISAWSALGAALCFAFSRTFWSQAVVAEVYGLSMFVFLLVFALALSAAQERDGRFLLLMAFGLGVGLTAHLNQVLLLPALCVLFVWRWPTLFGQWRRMGAALLGALMGYSLVLYLPLRNGLGPGFHWGDIQDANALWDHLTGALYRTSFFSLPPEAMLLNGQRWAGQAAAEFGWWLLPLVLWGIWCAWSRDRGLLLLAAGGILVNLIAVLNYHRDPNGIGVFFLLGFTCMGLLLGFGLDALARRLPFSWSGAVVSTLAVAVVLVGNAAGADRSHSDVAYRYGTDILDDLPDRAVLITEGDDAAFVLDYLLRVEHMRPDVTLYNRVGRGTDMLTAAERRWPVARQSKRQRQREAAVAQGERPLFYLVSRRAPIAGYEFVPEGLLYRLLPSGDERRAAALAKPIEMDNAQPTNGQLDPWARKIQSNYWFMLGERQRVYGDRQAALLAYGRAAAIAFDSRTVQFNVGLMMLRLGEASQAERYAEAALSIDPFQRQTRALLARIRRELR